MNRFDFSRKINLSKRLIAGSISTMKVESDQGMQALELFDSQSRSICAVFVSELDGTLYTATKPLAVSGLFEKFELDIEIQPLENKPK